VSIEYAQPEALAALLDDDNDDFIDDSPSR
jgi:hypothetical protein